MSTSKRFAPQRPESGQAVSRLGEVAGSVISADVALFWDADSWWALESRGIPLADVDGWLEVEPEGVAVIREHGGATGAS